MVIVSQSLAQRMFPNQDAVNHHMMWTDPVMKFIDISTAPRRIVGVVADIDDENVVPGPATTVYNPFEQQELWGGRLFVHVRSDPYALVLPITRIIRDLSADQPVEHPATLEDVRLELAGQARTDVSDVGTLPLQTATGQIVPLNSVATISLSSGPSQISRRDRLRVVTVGADLDTGVGACGDYGAPPAPQAYGGLRCGFAKGRPA